MTPRVFVSIVTYNHADTISVCLEALLAQEGFSCGENLFIHLLDNCSTDHTRTPLSTYRAREGCEIRQSETNLGFSAGNNLAAAKFLASECDLFVLINPDLKLDSKALALLSQRMLDDPEVDCATPLLLQCDSNFTPRLPLRIDSAGMVLSSSLRHFDRGQGSLVTNQFTKESWVFGASGACFAMKRSFVEDLLLKGTQFDADLFSVFPDLQANYDGRAPLFDESFFAYREDADLSWRAQILGKRCLYYPAARGYHVRKVTPEKRSSLSSEINLMGVRNRFLLQVNNYSLLAYPATILPGFLLRNMIVLFAVLILERSSLPGLRQSLTLFKRARERYKLLMKKEGASHRRVTRWIGKS